MHHSHLSAFADRAIRLKADHFGSPCLQVQELPEHAVCAPGCIASIHDAAPNDERGMDRLIRAVAAFNAIMDGAEMLPAYPGGQSAAQADESAPPPIAGEVLDATDIRRAGNRGLAQALDGAAARELQPHL